MTSGADDRRRREKKNKDDTEKVCEDRLNPSRSADVMKHVTTE